VTKKPDPKPRIPATPLSDEDRAALFAIAAKVSAADESTGQAREEQNALWRRLIAAGVTRIEIARASRVTPQAIMYRIAKPPSRINRGAGRARVNR
jgi:hypothetical protein